jgi:pentatricopeptide repeat protein
MNFQYEGDIKLDELNRILKSGNITECMNMLREMIKDGFMLELNSKSVEGKVVVV